MSEDLKLPETPAAAIPEDKNGDGLTERPSVVWLLWLTDMATEFLNGCIAGFGPGTLVGGGAVALTDSTNMQTLGTQGVAGFVLACIANGIKSVVIWHHSHPMPNPFRAPPSA